LGYEDMRADASFARIAELLDSDPQRHRDLMLLLGDQIYADASYGLIDNPSPIEKIAIRNRRAFSARGFNSVTSRLPTYMVIDDHEIDDMWSIEDRLLPKQAARAAARDLYAVAVASFAAYQWSHGPRNSTEKGFNYHFYVRGMAFFVLDTRTQRERFSKPPVVCTADQLVELERWLNQFKPGDTSPKFIATGSLVVPGLINASRPVPLFDCMAESWQMAPLQRAQVLAAITRNNVRNVVFLTGDIHCDATAELTFGTGLKAYAVVTPPLYAPLPGANSKPSDVLQHEVIDLGPLGLVQIDARANNGSGFADIHVDPLPHNQWRLSVHLYRLKLEDKVPHFLLETRSFLLG
jgi:phosphodiesterase/alkaline phosphatase D-like protein